MASTKPTLESMALSYASMCEYYELCVPGLETRNPHFKSSLHLFKKESSPNVENLVTNITTLPETTANISTSSSSSQPDNIQSQSGSTTNTKVGSNAGGSNLKLLIKGNKKDNKVHVKCTCNDIIDGSAIKRKFLVKCNKCHALVHGKCHNLNAQLFNSSNSNLSSSWYCSNCTVDLQNDTRKTAMAENMKRALKTSPQSKSSSHTTPKSSNAAGKSSQNRKETSSGNSSKDSRNKTNSTTKSKHKDRTKLTSNNKNNGK